jgi:hypothetical protein
MINILIQGIHTSDIAALSLERGSVASLTDAVKGIRYLNFEKAMERFMRRLIVL